VGGLSRGKRAGKLVKTVAGKDGHVDCLDAYVDHRSMPRPKSEDKRRAILAAATRIIVTQGLSASTMGIAKEAGVANGSLFTYFATKSDLFNALYLELKVEMASAAMVGLRESDELREQVFQVWQNWMNWALSFPEKRRALAQLGVSDEITPSTRTAASRAMAGAAKLMQRVRANGSMRTASMAFVLTLMNSLAEATMDFIAEDPANAKKHCRVGFDALWRMVA
jgi:AcrR family transcriptional regulator